MKRLCPPAAVGFYKLYLALEKVEKIRILIGLILVSATPLNNTPRDILSQVKLFQNGKNSNIPNVRNLEAFFARLEKNLQGQDRQRDHERYLKAVQANAKATREQILKHLMIRRTRNEIVKYYGDDLSLQGLKFPDVANPQPLFYKFTETENEVFNERFRRIHPQGSHQ